MSIKMKMLFTVLSVICLTVMLAVPAFAKSANLDIDPAGECVEGDAIVLTATSVDFTDPEYRFLYRVSGGTEIYTGQDREGSVWETTAPPGSAGTYDVAVQVREAGTTGWPGIGEPGFAWVQGYEILAPGEPVVSLTIDPAGNAVEGQEVTFTAESENVVNPEYRFLYRAHGGTKLYVLQIGTEEVWTETVPAGSAGTWDFGVQVREAGTSGWPTYDLVEAYVITEEDPVDEELEVVSVEAITDTVIVDYGTSEEDATAELEAETEYEGVVEDEDNVTLNVIGWTALNGYDGDIAGDYTFEGEAQAPEGYVLADDVDATVTATVTVEEEPVVDADNSSASWTDNEDGTGTMELIVHDQFDEPMTDFGMDDVEIFNYADDEPRPQWSLATLNDDWPAWTIDLTDNEDGTYTVLMDHAWDDVDALYGILVDGVLIQEDLAAVITKPEPVVDADNSSATWTDNEDGTGTMELIVRDQFDDPMTGFGMDDIAFYNRTLDDGPHTLTWADGTNAWTIGFTDNGDGTYTVLWDLTWNELDHVYDILVDDVVIEEELDIVITSNS